MCARGTGSLAHLEQQSGRAKAALWKGFGYNKEFKLEATRTDYGSPHERRQGWAIIFIFGIQWVLGQFEKEATLAWNPCSPVAVWVGHKKLCPLVLPSPGLWVTLLGEKSNSACSHLHVRGMSSSSKECFLVL